MQISPDQTYDPATFAKATKTLTKNCGGQLIHGLPEAAFDFALLWCPTSDLTPRDSSEPSWSWTAYSGSVNFPFDPSTCPDLYSAPKSDGELFRSEIATFTIGPPASPYTIRRETPDVLRAKYAPYFHAARGTDARTDSHTLRFRTAAISADGFSSAQMHFEGKELACSELLDDQHQQCGVLMDRLSALEEPDPLGQYEFVLLSRNFRGDAKQETRRSANPTVHPPGTPIWDGERFVWDQMVEDFDEKVYKEGDWCMLNVMLIRWNGEFAERLAVARIHEDAWKARGPVRKDIVLR
jgi:hypothetical protein